MSSLFTDPERPHLGGYVPGGDEATFFPVLWTWLVIDQGVKSVLDVGCGDGVALKFFRGLGCRVQGIDGIAQDDPDIEEHDFTKGPYRDHPFTRFQYDLVWCCEFLEHVEERFMPNYFDCFLQAPLVLITHGEPGQAGHHHVNLQTADYWKGAFAAHGYRYHQSLTTEAARRALANPSPWNHFTRSGMVFTKP